MACTLLLLRWGRRDGGGKQTLADAVQMCASLLSAAHCGVVLDGVSRCEQV